MDIITYPNKPKNPNFKLDVPYNNQNDNSASKGQGEGWRQCNLTSASMMAKYLKPSLWTEYSDFANGMQDALKPYGDSTDHGAVTNALAALGIQSYFSYSASLDDVAHALFCGTPVILGCKYKSGGHMVLAIGRQDSGLIIHCPYGDRAGTTDTWNSIGGQSGKNQETSWAWLNTIVFDQGNEAGWARFVTSVDGKSTGVKLGL